MKLLLALTILIIPTFSPSSSADAILGTWKNGSGKGHIQIYKNGSKYYGKIIWLKDGKDETGKPKLDKKNTNPNLRGRPLIGLVMLRDFVYDDGKWENGRIYNPSDGKEYKAYLKMESTHELQVRGYVGFSLLGKTDTWTRVK
jgi:uncharacterized protein (DUF2147 family)